MNRKYVFIATSTLLVGSALVLATINVQPADAKPQSGAPGQHECNPGHNGKVNPVCGPPGQRSTGTPGQCQNYFQGSPNEFPKKQAHDECHVTN